MKGTKDIDNLIEVSFSELKTWRRCQKKHHYKYVRKLQRKSKSLPLYKGSVVHSCLEFHYKGLKWKKAWNIFNKEFSKLMDEEKAAYGDLPSEVLRLVSGYLAFHKKDSWVVVTDKEGKPIVEREFRVRIPGTRVVVKGVIDLIIMDEYGGIWVIDHKTVKKDAPSNEFRMTDVQTTLYFWVLLTLCEELGIDPKKVSGSIFNYIRTKPPKEPEILESNGQMSRRDIDTCWMFYKQALIKAGLDPNDYLDMKKKLKGRESRFYYRHKMDKPKVLMKQLLQEAVFTAYQIEAFGNQPARSLDKSCDWDCDFKELCYSELQGHDVDYLIKTMYEKREGDGIEQRKRRQKGLEEEEAI